MIVIRSIFAAWAICGLTAIATAQTPQLAQGNYGVTINSNGGHVSFGGGAPPSLNEACGISPGIVAGTDSAFHFVSGTSTSATCTITPFVAWLNRPTCSVESETGNVTFAVATNGVITLSGVADSTRYYFICLGQPGG